MATNTNYLGLILPGFGEFEDSWWEPLNANTAAIDAKIEAMDSELINARQTKASLLLFLQTGHESDGSLKATPEVVRARNSFLYGHRDGTSALYTLSLRLAELDKEVWAAREGQTSLRDGHAFRDDEKRILTGMKDVNGYPSWMGAVSNKVQVDGSVEPLNLKIDGKICRVRTLKELTLTGAAGTKYVYAQHVSGGEVTLDGDSTTAPPATANGITSLDVNDEATLFSDLSVDFTAQDVQAGDVLELVNSLDAGQYLISEVAPGGNVNQLKIVGTFPVGGVSSIDYTVKDPLAVTLGFDTAEVAAAGKIYLGEAYFDGAVVADFPTETGVKVRPRHFQDTFVSEWRAVDVSTVSTFTETFRHRLGSDVLDVSIQVSQADDGSAPVEELSLDQLASTLDFTPGNGTLAVGAGTLAVSNVALSAGDQTVSTQPALTGAPALSGTTGGALTGSVASSRAAAAQWTKNDLKVKNVVNGVFYKDFDNIVRQTGFIRVVVRKRG